MSQTLEIDPLMQLVGTACSSRKQFVTDFLFRLYQLNNSVSSSFRQASNLRKIDIESTKCASCNNTKKYITSQRLSHEVSENVGFS